MLRLHEVEDNRSRRAAGVPDQERRRGGEAQKGHRWEAKRRPNKSEEEAGGGDKR